MGLEGKIEANVEIKSPADLFFKRLSEELYHLPDASPGDIHGVEVHEGDHKTPGSSKEWSYTIDGKKEVFKERLEVDKAAMTFSMVAVDGHVLKKFKSYKIMNQVIPSKDGSAVVKVTLVYEKFKETDNDPHNYLQFITSHIKDLDEHLIAQK